ncbi:RHN1, partial [Symbiodinium microadriaticum]
MASGKKKLCQLFDRKALLRRVLKKDKVLATQEAFQVAKKTLPRTLCICDSCSKKVFELRKATAGEGKAAVASPALADAPVLEEGATVEALRSLQLTAFKAFFGMSLSQAIDLHDALA